MDPPSRVVGPWLAHSRGMLEPNKRPPSSLLYHLCFIVGRAQGSLPTVARCVTIFEDWSQGGHPPTLQALSNVILQAFQHYIGLEQGRQRTDTVMQAIHQRTDTVMQAIHQTSCTALHHMMGNGGEGGSRLRLTRRSRWSSVKAQSSESRLSRLSPRGSGPGRTQGC
jgi:hypothetical protein